MTVLEQPLPTQPPPAGRSASTRSPSPARPRSAMWTVSRRNLMGNKFRIGLTAMAIVLGVGFVVASFVLADSLRSSFDTLSREISAGIDLSVRSEDEFGSAAYPDDQLLAEINAIDGVRVAEGLFGDDNIVPVKANGDAVTTSGPPIIGFGWITDDTLRNFTLTEGTAPGPGQFVMDLDSAERHGFVVGATYGVVSKTGSYQYQLTGLASFGENNTTNGALLAGYDVNDVRTMLGAEADQFDSIDISLNDDATAPTVQAEVAALLPSGMEVVNQRTVEEEQAAEFNSVISILENILLGFAAISLFVSAFIIYNTFGIILAQRVCEIGLLRAIGAKSSQVRRAVLGESAAIGFVASIIGIGAGIGLAWGLRAFFDALDMPLPPGDTIVSARTIIVAIVVGVGVTVFAALAPARRASSITPISAMTGITEQVRSNTPKRVLVGLALLAMGIAAGSFGLFVASSATPVVAGMGLGMLGVFIGVVTLAPVIATPVTRALGLPIAKLLGTSGNLARLNAGRNPRRTATTAGALMIGLSLVTTALVVGESGKAQIRTVLAEDISADYLISSQDFEDFPPEVLPLVSGLPELGTTVGVSEVDVQNGDDLTWLSTTDLTMISALFELDVSDGAVPETTTAGTAMLAEDVAERWAVVAGDSVDLTFVNGEEETFLVRAVYANDLIIEHGLLDRTLVEQTLDTELSHEWIATQINDGYTAEQADEAMAMLRTDYPQLESTSRTEYREQIEGEIDQLMQIVNAMLALAILIALLGIGLTLALSVFERTRELGLLRAVGMTRRQLRRMVRWEAALVATFGAVLGAGIGLLFGSAAVIALPAEFTGAIHVPVARLLILIGLAAIAGLVAALLPARRAGKLNILEAIAVN